MTYQLTLAELDRALRVRARVDAIESEIGSRFYGLENETQKGTRVWSIAPRAPHAAVDAIKGTGAPAPDHILKRWCNIRRAWRSIDLSTTRRVWYTDSRGVKREVCFE
ncbi:MAG: hypothetical protein ACXW13_00065 [Burkholderiaceae bacterium]